MTKNAPRRRRWRRFLLFALLGLFVLTVAAALLRNVIARPVVESLASRALGIGVELDSIHVSFGGAVTLRGFRTEAPPEDSQIRALDLRSVHVEASVPGLVRNGIEGIRRVEVDAGTIDVDLDRPGTFPESKKDKPRKPLSELLPKTIPEVLVNAGRVAVKRRDLMLELLDTEIRSVRDENAPDAAGTTPEPSNVTISTRLDWRLGGRQGAHEIRVAAGYTAGALRELAARVDDRDVVRAGRFDIANLRGDVRFALEPFGKGSITLEDVADGTARLAAVVEEIDIAEVERFAIGRTEPRIHGIARVEASGTIDFGAIETSRTTFGASATELHFDDTLVGQASAEGSLAKGELSLSKLELSGPWAEVRGTDVRAAIASFEPAELLAGFSASFDVRVMDAARFVPDSIRERHEAIPAVTENLSVVASADVADGGIRVRELLVESPNLRVVGESGSLTLDLDAPLASTAELEGRIEAPDLHELASWLGDDAPTGGLDARFRVAGRLDDPTVSLDATARSLGWREHAVGSLTASVTADRRTARLEELVVREEDGPKLRGRATGAFEVETRELRDVALTFEAERLAERFPELGDTALADRAVQFDATASGSLTWPRGTIDLRTDGSTEPILLLRKDADSLELEARALPIPDGTFSCALAGTVARDARTADLAIDAFDLTYRGESWTSTEPSRLQIDLPNEHMTLEPPLAIVNDRGRVEVRLEPIPNRPLAHSLDVVVEAPDTVAIPLLASAEAGPLTVRDGRLEATALFEIKTRTARDFVPNKLSVRGRVADIRNDLAEAEANLELDFTRNGPTPSAIAVLRIPRFVIDDLAGDATFDTPLDGSFETQIAWDGTWVDVSRTQGVLGPATLTAGGRARFAVDLDEVLAGAAIALPEAIDLRAEVRADDLSFLRRVHSDLRRIDGAIGLDLELHGTGADPQWDGQFRVDDVELRFGDVPPLDAVSAIVDFQGDAIDIRSLRGEIGAAPFAVTGGVRDIFGARTIEVDIDGDNILLARDTTTRVRADLDLEVRGRLDAPRIGGVVTVTDAKVLRDIPLLNIGEILRVAQTVGTVDDSVRADTGAFVPFRVRGEMAEKIRFDVLTRCEKPVEIRGNVFRGYVRTDLTLRGTAATPFFVGSVLVEDARVTLPATRLRIDQGIVRFDEKTPLFPELNLNGTTRMHGYDITVSVTGTLLSPTVVLASQPPLPADDLILLVSTGRRVGANDSETDKQAFLTVAQYLGSDLLRQIFTDADVDAGESFLERFEFEAGRNLSRSGAETWEARFRLSEDVVRNEDSLYLTGERDEFDHYNMGLRLVIRGL